MMAMLAALGCQKPKDGIVINIKPSKGEPLAQVGDVILTVEEVRDDFLGRQGSFKGAAHLNTDKRRTDFVDNVVLQEAIFQESLKGGEVPKEVINSFKKAAVQYWVREMMNKAQNEFAPSEQEMKDYYDKNSSFFKHEEAIKIAYLGVPVMNDMKKAKEIAQKLQTEASKNIKNMDTREFARLAMKYAQESQGPKGHFSIESNDSGFLEKEAFETKFGKGSYDAVKSMPMLGNVGPMLSTDTNFYVFMKTGERQKLEESFEEAKPKIVKRLAFEKRGKIYEDAMAQLKEKYKVKVYQDKIAEIGKDPNAPETATAQANGQAAPQDPASMAAAQAAQEALMKRAAAGTPGMQVATDTANPPAKPQNVKE